MMTIRDVQSLDARGRIGSERDDRVYAIVLLIWFVAISLLLHEIFDIRPAAAQTVCGDRAVILENLAKFHSERPRAIATSVDGKLLEVVVSSTGSWSILLTRPNRRTCVVATGEGWESLPAVARDDPSA